MRTRLAFLALAVALLAAGDRRAGADREADGTLKVMTFNIQHGIDGTHKYKLHRAIETIVRIQPDLVGLQEVTRNHPYYNCDDQPATLAEGLKAATGRMWSVAYEQEWFTPTLECQQSDRGDGKETEGLAFLAPGPLGSTSMTPLPVSRIAFAVRLEAFHGLPVIVTHLASGRRNVAARQKEIEALLAWSRKFGPPQILLGDFNALPGDVELQPVLAAYRDAWQVGAEAGTAVGRPGTHGGRRIDLIFFQPAGDLELVSIETIETAGWLTKAASDHEPVVATFRVRRAS